MSTGNPLAVLQRVRATSRSRPRPGERCELCAIEIGERHAHVVDVEERALKCTCRPCSFLFASSGPAAGRLRTVPERYLAARLVPGALDLVDIPVEVAFFFRSSVSGRVTAFYPGPAGATESLLEIELWDGIVADADVLDDVEAVLVRGGSEAYVVPIDACYELIGNLRRLWRGFDGGREARDYTEAFFEGLRARAS
jgi:hypothetical protein